MLLEELREFTSDVERRLEDIHHRVQTHKKLLQETRNRLEEKRTRAKDLLEEADGVFVELDSEDREVLSGLQEDVKELKALEERNKELVQASEELRMMYAWVYQKRRDLLYDNNGVDVEAIKSELKDRRNRLDEIEI